MFKALHEGGDDIRLQRIDIVSERMRRQGPAHGELMDAIYSCRAKGILEL